MLQKYLRRLAVEIETSGGGPEDAVSSAVARSASETITFLQSRQRFWTQAASSQ